MARTELLTPIITNGVSQPHFFNGRVLTADDLSDLQIATRKRHAQLGEAIGAGVVKGLRTTGLADGTGVRVGAGLAIARDGTVLELPDDRDISVAGTSEDIDEPHAGFAACDALATSQVSNAGLYVLAMSPASEFQGAAPKVATSDDGVARGCGSRYLVEGVRFRVVPLNLQAGENITQALVHELIELRGSHDPSRVSRYRNIVAHVCLGTPGVVDRVADPFGSASNLGAVEQLFDSGVLKPCEVPVTLFLWDSGGIEYVDDWSVRRLAGRSHARVVEAASANGAERLEQFADHMQSLVASGDFHRKARIETFMRFVPAAGYIPVHDSQSQGFGIAYVLASFDWGGLGEISAGQFAEHLRRAESLAPIDLDASPCLERLQITEHEAALGSGQASQRYMGYVHRSTQHRAVVDLGASTFVYAWHAYQDAIRRGAFVFPPETLEALEDHLSVHHQLSYVSDVANRFASVAYAEHLDPSGLVSALTTLGEAQRSLAISFQSPGNDLGVIRIDFGVALQALIDGPLTDHLNAGDACGAAHVQRKINDFVLASNPGGINFGRRPEFESDDDNVISKPGRIENKSDRAQTYVLGTLLRGDANAQLRGYTTRVTDAEGRQLREITLEPGEAFDLQIQIIPGDDADPIDDLRHVEFTADPAGTDLLQGTITRIPFLFSRT